IVSVGQNFRRVFTRTLPSDPKKDFYFMHRETGSVDTTIIEYGFADSTKDDVQQLMNHWKDYAEAVVKAFCEHIGVTYIPPATKEEPPKAPPTGTLYRVQVGAFSVRSNAEKLAAELRDRGYSTIIKEE